MSVFTTFGISCCLFFTLQNPFISLERIFTQPVFILKTLTTHPNKTSPLIEPKTTYKLVLAGDSLTEFLGNNEALIKDLKNYYPNKSFQVENFSVGSTNILSLEDRLSQKILKQDFDVIIIESFANNPLSQFPLEEGLKKQNEALEKAVKLINHSHPKSVIIFMATISPNRVRYGEGVINLLPEQRRAWTDERIAYLKNHIEYAKKNNIYLIDVYDLSKDQTGDGNIDYLNTNDFIHPSVTGIGFISQNIADFIFEKRILPL